MSTGRPPGHAAVHWLTAQSFLFGAMAALLGIVANAMFLEAYGPGWLPVTYIAIGIAGVVVSGTIAQSAQRFDMMRIAVIVLGGAAVLFGIAWAIAAGGSGAWVSASCWSCSRSSSSSDSCSSAARRAGSSTSRGSRRASPGS